jgi:hypothetical protein
LQVAWIAALVYETAVDGLHDERLVKAKSHILEGESLAKATARLVAVSNMVSHHPNQDAAVLGYSKQLLANVLHQEGD